jgi:hypothetical protein
MMHPFSCWHLPFIPEDELLTKTLTFTNHGRQVDLTMPLLEPALVTRTIGQLREHQRHSISQLRVGEIVEVIDEAVHLWLKPSYEKRQLAEEWLPVITGYDHEMIRLFLSRYFRQFRKESLLRMIDEDFSNPLVLDEFRPRKAGGLTKAYGPELITHIFSGNVPGLPMWSLVSGMLVKSAALGKVSSSEPLFPVLFAKTIEEVCPDLGRNLAIVWWKGGQEELEQAAYDVSDAVIAYGSEETTQAISKKLPPRTRYFVHGHKVSFGVITEEALQTTKASETAQLAAFDASWFDQQGCLSPHLFFVECGGRFSPRDFAQMLAQEMARFEHKLPRADLSAEESHAILQARTKAEFDVNTEVLFSEEGTAWTVLYRETNTFLFSPLNRFVSVIPINQVEEIPTYLRPVQNLLQTAGIAASPIKFRKLTNILGQCGVNRICALGQMPQPQSGWHHDGRLNLADLVRWTDVESSVEAEMDRYDPERL